MGFMERLLRNKLCQGNLRDVCNGAQLAEEVVFLKERRMKRLV